MQAIKTIDWSVEFELGCLDIDADHRIIVDLYNDLVRAAQRGASHAMRCGILATLIRFSFDHAHREAEILRCGGCAVTAEHVVSHTGLRTQAVFLRLDEAAEAEALHAIDDLRSSILHGLRLLRCAEPTS